MTELAQISKIEQNLFMLYGSFAGINGLRKGRISERLSWVSAGSGSWPETLYGNADESTIHEIVHAIEQDILPKYWICKRDEEGGENQKLLEFHGFRKLMEWPGMLRQLKSLRKSKEGKYSYKKISLKTFPKWLHLVNQCLFPKSPIPEANIKSLFKFPDLYQFHSLWDKKELCSVCMSFDIEDITGIYMVGTSESQRGKGFASALIRKVMETAKANSKKQVVLQANSSSLGMYNKLKFEQFCIFDIYGYIGS